MIIDVKQTERKSVTASFEFSREGKLIGSASFVGKCLQPMFSDGCIGTQKFSICETYRAACTYPRECNAHSVFVDGRNVGEMFVDNIRCGIIPISSYFRFNNKGVSYDLYTLGFGKDGLKGLLFLGDMQIALIEKPAIIYNGLNTYTVYAVDEDAAKISLMFILYVYANVYFVPGETCFLKKEFVSLTTRNKRLLEKYDPGFKEKISI